jgi:hypothetical protein
MPRSSRPTAHRLAGSPQAVTRAPPARAGSFLAPKQPLIARDRDAQKYADQALFLLSP